MRPKSFPGRCGKKIIPVVISGTNLRPTTTYITHSLGRVVPAAMKNWVLTPRSWKDVSPHFTLQMKASATNYTSMIDISTARRFNTTNAVPKPRSVHTILSKLNQPQTLTDHSSELHIYVIHLPPRYYKRFPRQKSVSISCLPHPSYWHGNVRPILFDFTLLLFWGISGVTILTNWMTHTSHNVCLYVTF
jgi:hypothetical protein